MSFSRARSKAFCETARYLVAAALCGALAWFIIFAACQAMKS